LNFKRTAVFSVALVSMLALMGCPPKKKLPIDEKPTAQEPDKTDENANADKNADANAIQIAQDWTEIPALQIVHFNYDNATLDDAARNALKANVAILKKLPASVKVRVEGHTDERGTVEYNIALGQRRANAVRSYYMTAGIGKTRLETISFGEERPLCTTQTDECYAMNRRGATKVRNAEPISVNPSTLQ
jgi:peptidoglycan-associated lipoprotein